MRPVERGAWRAHSQLPCRAILMCEQIISILLAKGQAAAAPGVAWTRTLGPRMASHHRHYQPVIVTSSAAAGGARS